MKVLEITEEGKEQFDEIFDEKEHMDLRQLAPEVMNSGTDVKFKESSIEEFDAVFAQIPEKNAVFGRVLLEIIEEKGLKTNLSSTGFFIMSKKNYLHHTLQEKNINSPNTAVVASEKSVRNVKDYLEVPLIARKFENLEEVEITKIEDEENIEEFAEGVEYGEDILIFSEHSEGDKFKCLVIEDDVISVKDNSEDWEIKNENLQYSNISSELEDLALKTRKSIGTKVAEVLIQGGKVVDVNPNPDLELYTKISGKNAFEEVAKALSD